MIGINGRRCSGGGGSYSSSMHAAATLAASKQQPQERDGHDLINTKETVTSVLVLLSGSPNFCPVSHVTRRKLGHCFCVFYLVNSCLAFMLNSKAPRTFV
jgi:hypothetical protein